MQRKAHSALQQYLAIFQKFTSLENDPRRELKSTFQKMQTETRSLLCFIESVINGTHVIAKRTNAAGVHVKPKPAPYKYYTQHVMERKLKGLTDALTDDSRLMVAKVVFSKFKDFVTVLTESAHHRMAKSRSSIATKTVDEDGNAAAAANGRVNEIELKRSRWSDSVQQPAQQNAVNKVQTKKPLRDRKNKNKKNNNKLRRNKNKRPSNSSSSSGGRVGGDKKKKDGRV